MREYNAQAPARTGDLPVKFGSERSHLCPSWNRDRAKNAEAKVEGLEKIGPEVKSGQRTFPQSYTGSRSSSLFVPRAQTQTHFEPGCAITSQYDRIQKATW